MEWITQAIEWVTANLAIILQIIGAFAAIATLTPNKSDDQIVNWLLQAINTLGGNLGRAKNADE